MSDRVVTGVCSLLQVPLALNFLGQEAFGLWMTLTSLVAVMNIADFGLGIGVQNAMSEAYGKDDLLEARRIANTGTLMLGFIGLVMFSLCAPPCFLIDWGGVFHIQDPIIHRQTGTALAIMVAAFCLGLPFSAAVRIAAALQLIWITNIRSSIQSVVTVILIATVAWMKLGLLSFLIAVVAPQLLSNLALLVTVYRRMGWSLNPFVTFDRPLGRKLFQKNWLFVLPNIGGTMLSLGPPLLISSMLGASALTPYNLVQRLLGLFTQAQTMFVAPFWPAYTEAVARGDIGWVRATYHKSLVISVLVAVIPTLSFVFWGRWALFLWSHRPPESFEMILVTSLVGWAAITNFSQPIAILLNSLGKIRGQSIYGLISVVVSLSLMPYFISRFGAAGAPISLLTVFALINTPCAFYEAAFHLRSMRATEGAAAI